MTPLNEAGWTSHGHPIAGMVQDPARKPRTVYRCGGPKMCTVCAMESAPKPQEPAGGPEVPPGVQEHLEAAGAALAAALAPLVGMVAERDDVIARLTYSLVELQQHLAAVLPLTRPSWAADVRTVEQATAALAALTPKEDDAEADRTS